MKQGYDTLPYYDWFNWQTLDEGTKHDWEAQLHERFGLDLNDTRGIYVDDGKVVGAVRYLRDANGERFLSSPGQMAVDVVGRTM